MEGAVRQVKMSMAEEKMSSVVDSDEEIKEFEAFDYPSESVVKPAEEKVDNGLEDHQPRYSGSEMTLHLWMMFGMISE